MKKLSIIVPVYNVQRYLSECIESIIISKKKLEIILVDDGSTDESSKICDEYEKRDKRIKTFHKKNGGVSSARNFGINKATGDYIMFVDSDDILSKDWDKIIKHIKFDDIYYYNSSLDDKNDKNKMLKYITGANDNNIYISGVYSKIYRRDFLLNNNIRFNDKLINGEDMIFNIEAVLSAKTIKIVKYHYYYYRQIVGQSTRRFDEKILNSDRQFHILINTIFKKYGVDNDVSSCIKHFCLVNAIALILYRISYIKRFNDAKKYFSFVEQNPYSQVINDKNNKLIIFRLCRKKRYRLLYYFFRCKGKFSVILKYNKKSQFIEI